MPSITEQIELLRLTQGKLPAASRLLVALPPEERPHGCAEEKLLAEARREGDARARHASRAA